MSEHLSFPTTAGRHPRRRIAGLGDPFAELGATRYPDLALTAYLLGSPTTVYEAGYHAKSLEELAHQAEPRLGDAEIEALHRELPRLVAYLDEAKPPPEVSLALFSCRPAGLLEGWRFHGETKPELWVMQRLQLEPLRWQLERQAPALVLVADKERTRAYSAVLDHVEKLLETAGQEIHVQRQGGASALNWQHKQESHARRNLDQLVQWLEGADDTFIQRVFLAGPDEPRAELRRRLPARYVGKLAGELHLPMYESARAGAERIRQLLVDSSGRHRPQV
jgi:hypothetical protein